MSEPRIPKSRRPVVSLLLGCAILLAGVAIGAGSAVLILRPGGASGPRTLEQRRDRIVGRIDEAVGLSEDQRIEVARTVEQRLTEIEDIRKIIRPKMWAQAQQLDAALREILRPEQLPAWETYFEATFRRFESKASEHDDEGAPPSSDAGGPVGNLPQQS